MGSAYDHWRLASPDDHEPCDDIAGRHPEMYEQFYKETVLEHIEHFGDIEASHLDGLRAEAEQRTIQILMGADC